MKCKWCSKELEDYHLEECNDCWELRSRVERNPGIAIKMIMTLPEKQTKEKKNDRVYSRSANEKRWDY